MGTFVHAHEKSRLAAYAAAKQAEEKKGRGTLILDVRQITVLADYFVIVGGDSNTQVRAIAEAIDEAMATVGLKRLSVEGKQEGRWVLLDYGSVIVHVLQEKERLIYKLEQFWNKALIVDPKEWSHELSPGQGSIQSFTSNPTLKFKA